MKVRLFGVATLIALLASLPDAAWAQGGRSSISGVVKDEQGGVLPGVTVIATDPTGTDMTAVTNESGVFSFPSISAGTYRVTLTLSGFMQTVVDRVVAVAASSASVNVTMKIGGMEEKIQVSAQTELIQSQSTTVATTLATDAIQKLPMITRNVMQSLPAMLVGVDQTGGDRSATINGLPQTAVKLTIDGIDVKPVQGDNATSSFYAYVYPAADAMEAVTVTSGQDASSAGDSTASVRFVTKSGTDRYSGSVFEYWRNNALNSNYFFNDLRGLPKDVATIHNYGVTIGGPVQIPALLTRGKVFFFTDLENYRHPTSTAPTRQILTPAAQQGVFSYNTAAGTQRVNLLQLAAQNGQINAVNPTVGALLAQIRSGVDSQGVVVPNTEPNTQSYNWQFKGTDNIPQPSFRVDANIGRNHRFTTTYHYVGIDWEVSTANPPRFPGLPNTSHYISTRTTGSASLRSVFGKSLVNVFTTGWQNQDTYNAPFVTAAQFENQGGFNLTFPTIGGVALTSATSSTGRQYRHAPLHSFDDSMTWQHGSHSLSFGGSFTRYRLDPHQDFPVAGIQFGVQPGVDPADGMFTTANFPGAAASDLTSARNLYGFLTGRVTAITANAALTADGSSYQYLGRQQDNIHMSEWGVFAQDQWRLNSGLTLNAGLRYQVQLGVTPGIANYLRADVNALCGVSGTGAGGGADTPDCNMFMPATLTGSTPYYNQFSPGSPAFAADLNNLAPNVGIAWRPRVEHGFWRAVLGDPEQTTIRTGFSLSFNHDTLGDYLSVFTANPGRTFSATRNAANGNLVLAGQSWPVLFSDTSRLGPPSACSGTITAACYPGAPSFPVLATTANSMSVFDPKLHEPYSRQFSVGIQRPLSKDMAIEVRYLRTDSFDGVDAQNVNEITVKENGFLDEFKQAQANLVANMAAGRGQSFAYFGPNTGTVPLPIFLASFNAVPNAQAGDPSKYTGSNWTNTAFTGLLNPLNPAPTSLASTNATTGLYGNATFRANGRAAGLPVNFWLLNPDVAAATYTTNSLTQKYHALQVELRRRLSHGLLLVGSYALSSTLASDFSTIHQPLTLVSSTAGVPQSAKFSAAWDIPFGRERAHGGSSSGLTNAVLGGWNIAAVGRAQSGLLLHLGGVRLVGMTEKDLQKAFKIRVDENAKIVYDLPQDIIDNTIRAFSSNVTGYTQGAPTGRFMAPASNGSCVEAYRGDCGEPSYISVRGPVVARMDLTFKKSFRVGGRRRFDVEYDLFNVFDAIQFIPVLQASSSATINQVTSAYTNNNTDDPGGRLGQIVLRFSW